VGYVLPPGSHLYNIDTDPVYGEALGGPDAIPPPTEVYGFWPLAIVSLQLQSGVSTGQLVDVGSWRKVTWMTEFRSWLVCHGFCRQVKILRYLCSLLELLLDAYSSENTRTVLLRRWKSNRYCIHPIRSWDGEN
jgi:hypothetical protein